MEDTVQMKRRTRAADPLPRKTSAQPTEATALSGEGVQASGLMKLHAPDGLAEHQRNPLAPPINITSNG